MPDNNNNNLEFEGKNKDIKAEINNILLRQMPHQLKLKEMLGSWAEIVGVGTARHSSPYDLIRGTLYVCADSSAARSKIMMMRNNLRRIIKNRWGLDVNDIRVTAGTVPTMNKRIISRKSSPPVTPEPEEVKRFREQLPEDLKLNNQKAADALAHLQAVFFKKFKI